MGAPWSLAPKEVTIPQSNQLNTPNLTLTNSVINEKAVFDLGQVSKVALKAKVSCYTRMRLKADENVQAVLDCRIVRESNYKLSLIHI